LGDIASEGDAAGVPTPNESYQYDPLYRLQKIERISPRLPIMQASAPP